MGSGVAAPGAVLGQGAGPVQTWERGARVSAGCQASCILMQAGEALLSGRPSQPRLHVTV